MNHFNVYAGRARSSSCVAEYERDVIRPHAWGRFEDLLKATAREPGHALLPRQLALGGSARRLRHAAAVRDGAARGAEGGTASKRGLNENYARELMELHTLGVDGGYTPEGRHRGGALLHGLDHPRPAARTTREFAFDEPPPRPRATRSCSATIIARAGRTRASRSSISSPPHPATARFVSTKLARRFVADEPPPALVDRAAATFRQTGGDIRAVVRTIVTSPEFLGARLPSGEGEDAPRVRGERGARRRARRSWTPSGLAQRARDMGMPLYLQQPPTGYKDTADAWVSTSGLLARLNFALDLAAGRVRGVS